MNVFRRLFNAEENKSDNPSPKTEVSEAVEEKTPETPVVAAADVDDEATTESNVPEKPRVDTDRLPEEYPPPPANDGATRQLPVEAVISRDNAHIAFGQSTDVGLMRDKNEDSIFSFFSTSQTTDSFPDFGIFIVADGMGGHEDGERASAIAVREVAKEMQTQVYLPMLQGQQLTDLPPITEVLVDAVQKANEQIHEEIPKGGGSTCTAVMLLGDRSHIAHVGDSRAYLIIRNNIEQITRDHSVVQRLVEVGQLTPDEAANHHRGNELYKALGFQDEVEVDVYSRRLSPGAKLLICSDGLWNKVDNDTIMNLVLNATNPQDACNKLVALANKNGGEDNISVLLLFA